MARFLRRHYAFTALLLAGLLGWLVATATVGEHYATAVGPDFLIKIPVALVKLAAILWLSRWFIRDRFPTIDRFTRRGDKKESEFEHLWTKPEPFTRDPRLVLCVAVHLGVPLIVSLVVLFAF